MCDNATEAAPAADSQNNPRPTVARWVHYWHRGSADGVYPPKCSAALVTGVVGDDPEVISATVFTSDGGIHPHAELDHDERPAEQRAGGTWHWPERVF